MTTFTILLGGEITVTKRLAAQVVGTRVIAADSGMRHAASLDLTPELWVGDFDSSSSSLQNEWPHVPRQTYSRDKAQSDGAIAISGAIERGASKLILVGAFGGQLDHILIHMGMLFAIKLPSFATSGSEEAYSLTSKLELPDFKTSTRLSVLPLSDLTGLSISGVKWPLQNENVTLGSSLTLANETTGFVTIALLSGRALVIAYPHE